MNKCWRSMYAILFRFTFKSFIPYSKISQVIRSVVGQHSNYRLRKCGRQHLCPRFIACKFSIHVYKLIVHVSFLLVHMLKLLPVHLHGLHAFTSCILMSAAKPYVMCIGYMNLQIDGLQLGHVC